MDDETREPSGYGSSDTEDIESDSNSKEEGEGTYIYLLGLLSKLTLRLKVWNKALLNRQLATNQKRKI